MSERSLNRVLAATGTADHNAYVWDCVCPGDPRFRLEGHQSWVMQVAFSPDDNLLMTASEVDETTRLWNPWNGRELIALDGFAMRWNSAGTRLAGLHQDNRVVWKVTGTDVVRSFRSNDLWHVANYAAISPDGRWFASCDWHGIRLWSMETGRELEYVPCPSASRVTFTRDGNALVFDDPQAVWRCPLRIDPDTQTPRLGRREPIEIPPEIGCVNRIAIDDSGRLMMIAARGKACVGAPDGWRLVQQAGLDRGTISPDGRWLATSSQTGGGIHVWNADGTPVRRLLPDAGDSIAAFSPDGRWLVGKSAREYRFWKVGDWELQHRLKLFASAGPYRELAFASKTPLLALCHNASQIQLLDPNTAKEYARLPAGDFQSWLCLSPDGRYLACMDFRMGIRVWDLRELQSQLAAYGLEW